jgi:hypothetical protein
MLGKSLCLKSKRIDRYPLPHYEPASDRGYINFLFHNLKLENGKGPTGSVIRPQVFQRKKKDQQG